MLNFKEMFKDAINLIAPMAVKYVEDNYTGIKGDQKKQIAVAFVLSKLPIPFPLSLMKGLIVKSLTEVIDNAIELALRKLKVQGS
jgi:hypothetical protein